MARKAAVRGRRSEHGVAEIPMSQDIGRAVGRSPEPAEEFTGSAPKAAAWSKRDVERARAELREFFETQGMGSHLELHARGTTAGSAVLVP